MTASLSQLKWSLAYEKNWFEKKDVMEAFSFLPPSGQYSVRRYLFKMFVSASAYIILDNML
jgi:hypothetical protein